MHGYYDYEPTRALERPLTLVSFVNQWTRSVANALASTTGLPLRLLDDVVEHRLGMSSAALLRSASLDTWRDAERRALVRAVRSRPPAIVALGEGALTSAGAVELVLAETDLVYLYVSLDEGRRLVVQQAANRKATLMAEVASGEACFEDELAGLYARRRAVFERARYSVDVYRRSVPDVVAAVLEALDRGVRK